MSAINKYFNEHLLKLRLNNNRLMKIAMIELRCKKYRQYFIKGWWNLQLPSICFSPLVPVSIVPVHSLALYSNNCHVK